MPSAENMAVGGKGLGAKWESRGYELVWGHVEFRGPWRCLRRDDKWAVGISEKRRGLEIYIWAPHLCRVTEAVMVVVQGPGLNQETRRGDSGDSS